MKQKMDPKLVASKQKHEIKNIASKYKIPIAEVRAVIEELKKEGKGYRSRKIIYQRLRDEGYQISTNRFR